VRRKQPVWLSRDAVLACHLQALRTHGGSAGLRDEGLLDSALARPPHLWHYEQAEMPVLAAAYARGIAKNHPFVDGNKRTAFLAAVVFLERNGWRVVADPAHAAVFVLALAAGELSEAAFAGWLADNTRRPRTRRAGKRRGRG